MHNYPIDQLKFDPSDRNLTKTVPANPFIKFDMAHPNKKSILATNVF